jgi:hypothetical protein
MKDEPYMPKYLGGSGDLSIGVSPKYIPFAPYNENLKYYILVTAGYHIAHAVVLLLFSAKRNDFVEMMLHHICAVYLFGGLYFLNTWEVGAVCAFLHDIADIFVNHAKIWGETGHDVLGGIGMLMLMTVWFYTRLMVLPYCMYTIYHGEPIGKYCREFIVYFLACMLLLHAFWFSIFVKMITKFLKEGVAEDLQNTDG